MQIKDILKKGVEILKENNIEQNNLKAKMLLSSILNKSKEYLIIYSDEEISKELEKDFFDKIEILKENTPIQYILNKQEFMGLEFYVDESVLIPQPDTEILAEEVIEIIRKRKLSKVLDLCTGSGAIAVSVAKFLENVKVCASDISNEAIKIARRNSNKNNVKIEFIHSDLFEEFSGEDKFDIIVSNPPYIKTDIIGTLSQEVQKEPLLALDGGIDGLDFYKKIIKQAKEYLNTNGFLALEIGYDQKEEVENILGKNGYKNIYSKKDLEGHNRIIIAHI